MTQNLKAEIPHQVLKKILFEEAKGPRVTFYNSPATVLVLQVGILRIIYGDFHGEFSDILELCMETNQTRDKKQQKRNFLSQPLQRHHR